MSTQNGAPSNDELTIRLDNGDTPARIMLRQLQAGSTEKLSTSRFTSHSPLANIDEYTLQGPPSAELLSTTIQLNVRFPSVCSLILGVDVLEFLDDKSFDWTISHFLDRDVVQDAVTRTKLKTAITYSKLETALKALQNHPNIDKLHIRIVWKTFLEDQKIASRYYFNPPLTDQLREQLRNKAMELIRDVVPSAASITACAAEEA